MKHTAQKIEEAKEARAAAKKKRKQKPPQNSKPSGRLPKEKRIENLRPFMFKPGQSGNPGGRPKTDFAAELARAAIEGNFEKAVLAFGKQLRKGNAYALSVLADRGYGKIKEKIEHSGKLDIEPDALRARIEQLLDERKRAGVAGTPRT